MMPLRPPRSATIISGMGTSGVPVQGELIRELRINLGYSGADFAIAVGVSAQHVSDMELGKRGASPKVLKRMATILEVEVPALRAWPVAA